MSGKQPIVTVAVLATLLLAAAACSDDEPADPDLVAQQSGADVEPETADLDSASNDAKAADDANGDAADGDAADGDDAEGDAAATNSEPQAADPYDDDWNDLGTQKMKEAPQQASDAQGQQQQQEEPELTNAPVNQPAPEEQPAPEPTPQEQPVPVVDEPPIDPEPAPMVEEAPPPPTSSPPAEAELPAITSGPPLVKQDIKPVFASLDWVGYDHVERDGIARVEMVTRGSPRFNLFQERNQSDQPELVVRFFQTSLRGKLRRDIDASEFRSPVAFIRMRPDEAENQVDVIITLRDGVQPRMYAKNGNIMLTFPLPDHYFGNNTIGDAPIAKAEVLPNSNIMPRLDEDSDISEGMRVAKAFINNPAQEAFKNAPADGGEPVAPAPAPEASPDATTPDGLPPDFAAPPEEAVPPEQAAPPTNVPMVSDSTVNDFGAQENFGANSIDVPANGQGAEGQGMNSEANDPEMDQQADGGANQQYDGNTGELDGEPAIVDGTDGNMSLNAAGSQQGIPADQIDNASEDEGLDEQSEQLQQELDEDSLDDFDGGDGDTQSEVDKFDVRVRRVLPYIVAAFGIGVLPARVATAEPIEQSFWLAGVAQDDLGGDGGDLDEGDDSGGGGNNLGGNNLGGNNNLGGGNNLGGNNNLGGGNNPGGNNNLGGGNNPGGGNNLGGGNQPAANGFGGNAMPADAAFGDGNTTGADAAVGAGQAAPLNPPLGDSAADAPVANPALDNAAANVAPVLAPDNGGVAAGEPPIAGDPDLAGEEQTGAETEAAPQQSAGGRPIKLDFRGAPLNEVIRMLGDESGVNFVFPPDIGTKEIFVNLNGVPFNDALKAVLEANALGMVEVGANIVRIDTLERLATDKEAEEKRKKAELKLRPTKVLVYRLSYAKVEDAQKMLTEMLGGAAREDNRISVQLDQRTNSIIVNAPPSDLAMVKALLERIDLETPQVKIASRIVEVQKKFSDIFGVSWTPTLNFDQGRGLGFGNLAFPNSMNSRFAVDAGGTAAAPGTMGFRFGSINNSLTLDLALAMEESRSAVEILQSGNLIVEDNAEAEIVAGASDFFRLAGAAAAGAAGEDLAEVTYNLTMKVKPHITADGAVQMKVTLESDSPSQPQSQGGGAIAAKNNRGVTTSLLRKSGETAVIGGIYNTQKQKGLGGVPGLMDIPIIGALFRRSNTIEEKRELLVMVTPTILNGAKAGGGGGGDSEYGNMALNQQNAGGGEQGDFGFNESNSQSDSGQAGDFGQGDNGGQGGFAQQNAPNDSNGQSGNGQDDGQQQSSDNQGGGEQGGDQGGDDQGGGEEEE